MDTENNKQENDPGVSGHMPPPMPPPPEPNAGLRRRLERVEGLIEELRGGLAAGEKLAAERSAAALTRDELKNAELRVTDLSASFDGLKRTFAGGSELDARLAQAEAALASLKTSFEGQQRKLRVELETLAPKDAVNALRVNLAAALAALDEMKTGLAQYSGELSALGSECRKTLGEAQGLAKAAERARTAPQFVEFLKDASAAMSARLAGLEVAMHAGLSELSGRMNANEILYNKMFSTAEERLKKCLEPKFKDIEGQLRWLRENVLRLSDDYTVAAERRIRALEAKYSAFEVMARRMEAIDAALKKSGRIGLP